MKMNNLQSFELHTQATLSEVIAFCRGCLAGGEGSYLEAETRTEYWDLANYIPPHFPSCENSRPTLFDAKYPAEWYLTHLVNVELKPWKHPLLNHHCTMRIPK